MNDQTAEDAELVAEQRLYEAEEALKVAGPGEREAAQLEFDAATVAYAAALRAAETDR